MRSRSTRSRSTLSGVTASALAFAVLAAAACATSNDNDADPVPPPGPDAALAPVDASDADDAGDGWVVYDAGPCSSDGLCIGAVPIDTRVNVTSISGSGAGDVWAVGSNRSVLHYDGKAWEMADPVKDEMAPITMRAVWVAASDDVWIADGYALRHSTGWKGPSATAWGLGLFIEGLTATISAISGNGGRVLFGRQISNSGWSSDPALVTTMGWGPDGVASVEYPQTYMFGQDGADGLWSLVMTRPDEAWGTRLGTDDRPGSRVVRMHLATPDGGDPDAGASWIFDAYDSRTARNLYAVWGTEQVVWTVGEGGAARRIRRENVGSGVFEIVPTTFTSDLRGVYGFGDDDVWVVGDDATVAHWDGKGWRKLATPFDHVSVKPRLMSVWGSSPDDVWIGGNGVMLHFEGKAP